MYPLHHIVNSPFARSQTLARIIRVFPDAANMPDLRSWLPLHIAAARCDGDPVRYDGKSMDGAEDEHDERSSCVSSAVTQQEPPSYDWMKILIETFPDAVLYPDKVRLVSISVLGVH